MNRIFPFLFFILLIAGATGGAAPKKPKEAVEPAQLPGMVDAKPPAFAVKASTAAKPAAAAGLAPAVTGQASLPSSRAANTVAAPPASPTTPAEAIKGIITAALETAAVSTATKTVSQAAAASSAKGKQETVPLSSLRGPATGQAPSPETAAHTSFSAPYPPAPVILQESKKQEKETVPAAVKTSTASAVHDAPEPSAPLAAKTTQHAVLEARPAAIPEKTTAQTGAALPEKGTTAQAVIPAPVEKVKETAVTFQSTRTVTAQEEEPAAAARRPAGEEKADPTEFESALTEETTPMVQEQAPEASDEENPPAPARETADAPRGKKDEPVRPPVLRQPEAPAHLANAPLPPPPVPRPAPKKEEPKNVPRETLARAYRVVAGDTLPLLAERYYGDKSEWVRIYEANKAHIEKGSLQKGQVLIIP